MAAFACFRLISSVGRVVTLNADPATDPGFNQSP